MMDPDDNIRGSYNTSAAGKALDSWASNAALLKGAATGGASTAMESGAPAYISAPPGPTLKSPMLTTDSHMEAAPTQLREMSSR